MTALGCGNGEIRGLDRCSELNGLVVRVRSICRDSHGVVRYMVSVPPQNGCPEGRQNVAIRRRNLIFNFRNESRAFGFNPYEMMAAFGAREFTPVCALRFRYYHERPTKEDVKLFFGREIYNIQRQALSEDNWRGGKGWWHRAGVMCQGGPVKDGVVFTTSDKHNQTSQMTEFEAQSGPSQFGVQGPCLWWPALIAQDATVGFKIVRCWEQNQRHSAPWWTPSPRCHEFDEDDNEAEDEWILVDAAQPTVQADTTVQIEELFDDAEPEVEAHQVVPHGARAAPAASSQQPLLRRSRHRDAQIEEF